MHIKFSNMPNFNQNCGLGPTKTINLANFGDFCFWIVAAAVATVAAAVLKHQFGLLSSFECCCHRRIIIEWLR